MRGKVVKIEGTLYIEYLGVGSESDEIEKKLIKLSVLDRDKAIVGETVEFQCRHSYSISDEEIATITKSESAKS